ncbi:MAG: hypothetical protein V3T17_01300 [Pseudomonadales bacterium]
MSSRRIYAKSSFSVILSSLLCLAGTMWLIAPYQSVEAALLVTPRRIVFDERTRSKEILLVNRSDKKATYRITFEEILMKEDGSFEVIDKKQNQGKYYFASDVLRYFPRQITLEAKKSQTVRLLLRKPKNLAQGEYMSYLLFQQQPPEDLGTNIENINKPQTDQLGIQMTALFATSIPVIVRHGQISSRVALENAKVVQEEQEITDDKGKKQKIIAEVLQLDILRSGNSSASGNFHVDFTPNGSKKSYAVGFNRGITVFHPLIKRHYKLTLRLEGVVLKNGKLHVQYKKRDDKTDESREILAETTITL